MVPYGDWQRLLQDVCDLSNNIPPEINPIVQSTVSKLVTKLKKRETYKIYLMVQTSSNEDQALYVLVSAMDNSSMSTKWLALNIILI